MTAATISNTNPAAPLSFASEEEKMPDCCDGRSIPVDHHAFQRLIRSVLQENPHFDRVQVKRKIVRLCGLPEYGEFLLVFSGAFISGSDENPERTFRRQVRTGVETGS